MYQISLVTAEEYSLPVLKQAVARHFSLLPQESLRPGMKVTIKPNLIMKGRPEMAATTHPALVKAVILHLRELGIKDITIADSPGGLYSKPLLMGVYEQTGMKAAANECGAMLNTDLGSKVFRIPQGKVCHEFDIIDPIGNADFVINLCKLKTHCMTAMSCGVKNLFGCVPGLLKPQLHYRFPEGEKFAQMLIDLSLLVRPGLTIVDGVDGMEGDGPTGGVPRHMGITAAATAENLYALDLVMCYILGFTPSQVPMVRCAIERELCPKDWRQVDIQGDRNAVRPLENLKKPATKKLNFASALPKPLSAIMDRYQGKLSPCPVIRVKDCIGCGRCAQICPAHTIEIAKGKAVIGPSKCIKCFCCHEMCPAKAIDIKSIGFFRLFSKYSES